MASSVANYNNKSVTYQSENIKTIMATYFKDSMGEKNTVIFDSRQNVIAKIVSNDTITVFFNNDVKNLLEVLVAFTGAKEVPSSRQKTSDSIQHLRSVIRDGKEESTSIDELLQGYIKKHSQSGNNIAYHVASKPNVLQSQKSSSQLTQEQERSAKKQDDYRIYTQQQKANKASQERLLKQQA